MTTIGMAIAVPEPWSTELQDYRLSLGDKSAHGIPTHITLAPPLEVDPGQLPTVEQHLAEAAATHHAFTIQLRGTGTFRPVSPVVFVSVVRGISSCEQLSFAVRRGPLAAEMVFPYHPHVTVAHDLDEDLLDQAFDDLASFESTFEVTRFLLYEHDAELGWQPTRDFPLTARADALRARPPRPG